MAVRKYNDLQLRFDLADFDELEGQEGEGWVTPEEARKISEAARLTMEAKAGTTGGFAVGEQRTPNWWQDYLTLRGQGWPWRVATYIAWASAPKTDRNPRTMEDLAKQALGLSSPRAIYTWRRKYPTIDTVVAMMQTQPLWEHRRDVLEALAEMAKQKDYKAFNDRKLYLEMTGLYTPKSEIEWKDQRTRDLSELTEEELDQLIGEADTAKRAEDDEADGA